MIRRPGPTACYTPISRSNHLDAPETAQPLTFYWLYAVPLTTIHVLALLAFVPQFFSWSGLILGILGHFTFVIQPLTPKVSARLCLQADGLEQIESFFLRRVGIGVHGEGRGVAAGV